MLKLLVKKQLTEIFRAYLYDAKKNRARSKAATVGYIIFFVLLMAGVIGGMFTTLSLAMCRSMAEAGMSWFYFAIMGLMAILLGAFGSVFTTYSSLYLPKDNDQMLSLPIPVNTLITARLLGVYLMGLMYSGVVVLPAIIVYWATVSAAPLHLLAGVLFLLLISLFVMAISCLLGWVVAKVSLKLKNKSFVTVVLSLVFFGLYYYFFSFKANSLLTELLQNIVLYGDKVRSSAYPVYLFGQAGAGDPLSMLLLTAAIAVLFGLTWLRSPAASSPSPRPPAMWAARSTGPRPSGAGAFPPHCWTGSCAASPPAPTICSTAASAHCFWCWPPASSCGRAGSCWSWCRSPSLKDPVPCRCCWPSSCACSAP